MSVKFIKLTRFDDSPIWLNIGNDDLIIEPAQPEGPNDSRIKTRLTYSGSLRYVKEEPEVVAKLIMDYGVK